MTRAASLVAGLLGLASAASCAANTSTTSTNVHWLGDTPAHSYGTTFGLPWARGAHLANATDFTLDDGAPLQSWVTAYWPDGSIKWSAHAVPGSDSPKNQYTVTASGVRAGNSTCVRRVIKRAAGEGGIDVTDSSDEVVVNTGKITATFPKEGSVFLKELVTAGGKTVGRDGKLVLTSQTGVEADVGDRGSQSINYLNFQSSIDNVTVSEDSTVRALVTVHGKHQLESGSGHDAWLPFILRFYLHADSEAIRLVHTIVYDGDAKKDFITGVGIRFQVPLAEEEAYNRHVRLAGVDGGLLSEAVQGITGLRRDPGLAVRQAQFQGKATPDISTWDVRVSSRMHWIPEWNDFSLHQLSPDGFTLRKRTKAGQGWINIPGATRAGGLAYLGGATQGGLAVGLRDFWKRYPTGLDIRNAASDSGEITLWIYSPNAEPLDLRPYHDGLGQETYAQQLDALEVTYEDWEGGLDTPYGISRTNEVFIVGFEATPSSDELADLTTYINNPPVLAAEPAYLQETRAAGTYWSVPGDVPQLDAHLDWLIDFYRGQVDDRRWYGFLDYGDVMHTYDPDRHEWRYDIGGYAWDNSELSPDLFIWLQFLRTGREDVYRFSEAMTRHTGEVDMYHLGKLRALGTRHGVQHYSDSAKQVRISNAQYRKYFYYISGGDERTGDIIAETLDVDKTFEFLDPNRKVRGDGFEPKPDEVSIGLGTEFSALSASWLLEWERRGPRWEESLSKLTNVVEGIVNLTNGFVSGSALMNPADGTLKPPVADPENKGNVAISHLSAMFGMIEVILDLTEHWGSALPAGFEDAWLDYAYYYNAPRPEQAARYGVDFGRPNQVQSHSRLTAYAALKYDNATLAARAWTEYLNDGLRQTLPWAAVQLNGSAVLKPVAEATWLSTNEFAQFGLATIQNLALVGKYWPGA
ncbi:hypothetical protein F5X68DRAFT_29531 [Plectosphaerella plurivora]|uniref:Tat pathway signal sequence domain protein n=1 Tax=Plectosphaerella plurivora TaxID=936078 RepID=A0A9P8VM92_9PEZI|nr:hypothetical protein F5X68DRAFT_29531 [Plectosphaerella plurivora]